MSQNWNRNFQIKKNLIRAQQALWRVRKVGLPVESNLKKERKGKKRNFI